MLLKGTDNVPIIAGPRGVLHLDHQPRAVRPIRESRWLPLSGLPPPLTRCLICVYWHAPAPLGQVGRRDRAVDPGRPLRDGDLRRRHSDRQAWHWPAVPAAALHSCGCPKAHTGAYVVRQACFGSFCSFVSCWQAVASSRAFAPSLCRAAPAAHPSRRPVCDARRSIGAFAATAGRGWVGSTATAKTAISRTVHSSCPPPPSNPEEGRREGGAQRSEGAREATSVRPTTRGGLAAAACVARRSQPHATWHVPSRQRATVPRNTLLAHGLPSLAGTTGCTTMRSPFGSTRQCHAVAPPRPAPPNPTHLLTPAPGRSKAQASACRNIPYVR
jgi:hypothetical protein